MKLNSYKELIVWQKAMDLAVEIFRITKSFPNSELYGITSQMRRSVISIPSNIAEGYGRKYAKEFNQFLSVAYGSAQELETQLILSERIGLTDKKEFTTSRSLLEEISKMLLSLIVKLNAKH